MTNTLANLVNFGAMILFPILVGLTVYLIVILE